MSDLVRTHDGQVEIDWGRLLRTDAAYLSAEEQFVAVSVLDAGTKAFERRLEDLKAQVRIDAAPADGASSRTVERGGVKITVTQRRARVDVNDAALLALLAERGLDPEQMCYRKALQLEPARLELCIASGIFTDVEVARFTTEGKSPSASVSVKKYAMDITADRLLGED